jgi:hypothetical protein
MFREMFSVFVAAATGDEDIYHNGSSVFSGNALSAEVVDVGAGHRRMYSGMQALQSLGRVAVRWLAAFVMRNDEHIHGLPAGAAFTLKTPPTQRQPQARRSPRRSTGLRDGLPKRA